MHRGPCRPNQRGEANDRPQAMHWIGRVSSFSVKGSMLGWLTGFEPATSWATAKRSNQTELQPPPFVWRA